MRIAGVDIFAEKTKFPRFKVDGMLDVTAANVSISIGFGICTEDESQPRGWGTESCREGA